MRDVSPRSVNRVLCYCDDCQAFAHHLERADLLDAHGGSDIVQVAPASLSIDRGLEHAAAVRLGPKGMYRWFASCCRTPLGNVVSPSLPFVGIVRQALRCDDGDDTLGPVRATLLTKFAVGGPPSAARGMGPRFVAHTARLLLGWKLRGRAWPHPFFDRATGGPIRPATTLSKGERDALRALCGPRPTRPHAEAATP